MGGLIDKLFDEKVPGTVAGVPNASDIARGYKSAFSSALDPLVGDAVGKGIASVMGGPMQAVVTTLEEGVGSGVDWLEQKLGLKDPPFDSLSRVPLLGGASLDTNLADGPFTFVAPGFAASDLEVVSFHGAEELSRMYSYEVLVNQPLERMGDFERQVLGMPARLTIRGVDELRVVSGVVHSVRVSGSHRDNGSVFYKVKMEPTLALLRHTRWSRIFQEKTAKDIVTAVLNHHGIVHRWDVTRRYRLRDYCVQHQETDLHFVRRLLAEEGIFFTFEHPSPTDEAKGETVVFGDTEAAYQPLAGNPTVPFRDPERAAANEEHIASFELVGAVSSGATRMREFDFKHPATMRTGTARVENSPAATDLEQKLEVYTHHEEYEGDDIDKPASVVLLEQLRRARTEGHGTAVCPRLVPGRWFEMVDNNVEPLNAKYVVVRVEHEGYHALAEGAVDPGHGREQRDAYKNRFVCAPASTVVRPKPVRRKIQQSTETAIVVGPFSEEIHTDTYGRIKVQFHWDLDGRYNSHSSCWIRTAQNWAGNGWGFQFIPRIGMEVIVTFLAGDTDRPVVTGCVYNGEHPEPWALPEYKTISGIRTRSTLRSEGFNELSFEDLRNAEKVFLRAQRDFEEKVLRDHTRSVGRFETLKVTGDQKEEVGKNQDLNVGGDRTLYVGRTDNTTVEKDQTLEVGGDRRVQVAGSSRAEITKDKSETVLGSLRERVVTHCGFEVGGNFAVVCEGLHRVDAHGGSCVTVDGRSMTSVAGDATMVVTGKQLVSLQKTAVASIAEDLQVDAKKALFTVTDGMTFVCGDSVIEMTREGIKITAPKLEFKGTNTATLRGGGTALLSLDGKAALTGSEALVRSKGAKLALTGEATLVGAKVKLASGAGGAVSDSTKSESKKAEKKEWKIKLYAPDPKGKAGEGPKPLANVSVTATGHGPERFSGSTDGGGMVSIPVVHPECLITIHADNYVFHVHAGGLLPEYDDEHNPAKRAYAAARRLHNLGYGPGDADAWDNTIRASTVSNFQQDQHMDPTVGLDKKTEDCLKGAAPKA